MKIAIAGSGAMGCRFGYALHEAGHDVLLIDGWREHVEAIRGNGLEVIEDNGKKIVQIDSALPEEATGEYDLLIVLTKSMQTKAMMEQVKHLIGENTAVLTLQNGLGNVEIIEAYVDRTNLLAGVTTLATELLGPGKIQALGSGDTEIMQVDGNKSEQALSIIEAFRRAGIPVEISDDVMASIWKKAAFNSALNPLCTLMNNTVATVGSYEQIGAIVNGIVDEIVAVAHAENVALEKDAILQMVNSVFDPSMSGHHIPSMLQDIHNGRPTEIDYMNGAIARLGEKHNIPTPNNTLIYHLIKMLERTSKTPLTQYTNQ